MQTFVWDDHFTTGLARVDEQHHRLVDLINDLGTALVANRLDDPGSLDTVFGRLADYARHHFAEEERLMAAAGLAERARSAHQRHHGEFIEQVSRMWSGRAAMSHPAEVLHGFLSAWLGFHILGEDQAMARQIREIAAGASPADAQARAAEHDDNATTALLRALNNLYHVLSAQNRDLAAANAQLEARVAERTRELEAANQALAIMAHTDGLLGIANRKHFDDQLAQEWRRARRTRQPVGLLMLDVDFFKKFNDAYGHQAGDRCLQAVARAAGEAIRRPADLLARYGGEELVVILPATDLAGAETVAQNVLAAVGGLRIPHEASLAAPHVTVSIGVASRVPEADVEPAVLIAAADAALYAAKGQGRNRACAAP